MAKRKKKRAKKKSLRALKAKLVRIKKLSEKNVRDLGVLSHMFD